MSDTLREDCKVICFSTDRGQSFGYELSRMWAYYGDNHKGVCLLINKEEFLAENRDKIDSNLLRKVSYYKFDISKPITHKNIDFNRLKLIGQEKYLKGEFRRNHLDYLYFTKNSEWETEHEVRLIYFSDNKDNEYCTIKNSLKGVYLGVDFNDVYLPAVMNLCKNINIDKLKYLDFRLVAESKHIARK